MSHRPQGPSRLVLLLTASPAVALGLAPMPAAPQQLSVTNGTTGSATGAYAAPAAGLAGSALYAAGQGSRIEASGAVALTSGQSGAAGAAAENNGTVDLLQGSTIGTTVDSTPAVVAEGGAVSLKDAVITTSGAGSAGVFANGAASSVTLSGATTITTTATGGIAISAAGAGATIAGPATIATSGSAPTAPSPPAGRRSTSRAECRSRWRGRTAMD